MKKKQPSAKHNKSGCTLKKSKTERKTKKNKYGPKLNIPCCIGSKNPCNRQKIFDQSLKKYLKAGCGVLRYNSETS